MKRAWFLAFLALVCDRGGRDEVKLSGTVEVKQVRVSPETVGKIDRMFVERGDSVVAGQVLFCLDTVLLAQQLAIAQAQAQALSSQAAALAAQIAQLGRDIKRAEELLGEGAVPEQKLEELRSARDALMRQRNALLAQAEAARSASALAAEPLARSEVKSPVSGVVLDRSAEAGEITWPASPVYTIGVLDSPWVRVYVPEKYVGRVKLGTEALVKTDAFEEEFPGRVVFISQSSEFTPKEIITPEERTSRVFEVHVLVKDARLYPGMYADVRLRLGN